MLFCLVLGPNQLFIWLLQFIAILASTSLRIRLIIRCNFTLWPIRSLNIGIYDLVLKVDPDALVVAAVIGATRHGTVFPYPATASASLDVRAVAVLVVRNEVRVSQVPFDDAFVNVLFGQCEAKTTTGCMA